MNIEVGKLRFAVGGLRKGRLASFHWCGGGGWYEQELSLKFWKIWEKFLLHQVKNSVMYGFNTKKSPSREWRAGFKASREEGRGITLGAAARRKKEKKKKKKKKKEKEKRIGIDTKHRLTEWLGHHQSVGGGHKQKIQEANNGLLRDIEDQRRKRKQTKSKMKRKETPKKEIVIREHIVERRGRRVCGSLYGMTGGANLGGYCLRMSLTKYRKKIVKVLGKQKTEPKCQQHKKRVDP